MNKDKYVFAQLVAFLDNNKFRHLVDKYDGNRYVKNFTCWNQLMALMFGQLCNRESLRDVVVALETHSGGQSSARRKEALRRMSFMIWSPKFLLSSILRLHRYTIQRQ